MSILGKNQRAHFDYDVKDTFIAGLALEGREVKSLKSGNVSLNGSYVSVNAHGASLLGCHIGPYSYAPNTDYNPTKTRQLLLNKREINQFLGKEKGLVVIPIEIFTTPKGLIKLKIGIAKPRKKIDKREYIKKKDTEKEIRRYT